MGNETPAASVSDRDVARLAGSGGVSHWLGTSSGQKRPIHARKATVGSDARRGTPPLPPLLPDATLRDNLVRLVSAATGAPPSDETRRATWRKMYPKASDDAIDLLAKLMQYDPEKRITAAQGLEHPYCQQFHDPDSEVIYKVADKTALVNIDIHDNKKLTVTKYRDLLYHMADPTKQGKA